MLRALLVAARPRQWVKNLFVGAPVVFARKLLDSQLTLRAAAAVAIFSLIASSVYLWNDLVDVEKDRAHPIKKHRPIASGALPIGAARAAAASFAAIGLALAWLLSPAFAMVTGLYVAQNIAYSLVLKRVPYVDVLTIASGFLLRVWAGTLAVDVWASPWLFACTALLATFLGFGKRAHELRNSGEHTRGVLAYYNPRILSVLLHLCGVATVITYAFYTTAEHTREFFGTARMVWTVPFVAVGIGRFLYLADTREDAESPTEEMLRDPIFLANLAACALAVLAVIYLAD